MPYVTIRDCMQEQVETIDANQPLIDAVDRLQATQQRHLCVTEGDRLVGILSDRDVKRALPSVIGLESRRHVDAVLDSVPVGKVMTRDPVVVTEDTPLEHAVGLLIRWRIGCLPVVRGRTLVGMLTELDCLAVLGRMLRQSASDKAAA